VVLRHPKNQPIAERYALIDGRIDNLLAMLDSAEGCGCCGRRCKKLTSKLLGVTPDCARQYHIEYSKAVAERRLVRRRSLLGSEGDQCPN
jgi:hypothetical protein